jgi:segregation and condensation protein B
MGAGFRGWPRKSLRSLAGRASPSVYRLVPTAERASGGHGPLARDSHVAVVEAALLAAEEPLTTRKLAEVAGLKDAGEARLVVKRLQGLYQHEGSALHIVELAGGFQLLTRPEYHSWLAQWRQGTPEGHLSAAARETLAIVAYRQPVMRADIESIRGVQCGEVLRMLMDKGFVRIAGRHPSLGRPVLYGTTRRFLQVFGLKGLEDLPLAEQLRKAGSPFPANCA